MKNCAAKYIGLISITVLMTVTTPGITQVGSDSSAGMPISVKLIEVSMEDFLRVISEVSGLNILIDPDVKGSLTINVEKVPWDQLLDTVLESHDLTRSEHGNLIRIARKETLQQQEEARQSLKRDTLLLEDLLTAVRPLDYARGKTLLEPLEPLLTERGQIRLDERTNTFIIRDTKNSVERISKIISKLDKGEPQVEIEARIVETTTKFSRQLGAQFGFRLGTPHSRYRAGIAILSPIDQPAGSASISLGGVLDTVSLDASISAAEMNGEARMISKPRICTLNNTEARIVQGAKIPIPVQMNYTTNVRYETAALNLSVKPQIAGDRRVSLEIKVENSVPDFTQTVRDIPTILTSESHTRILVRDGATAVIGGILVKSDRKGEIGVPGFSHIPLLGRLFKKTNQGTETREILFFITSRIRGDT